LNIRKSLSNVFGWATNRKIIVFESDDWGSVRTRSSNDYQLMLKQGLNVSNSNFTKFDKLESEYDLIRLFDLLSSFKDFKGNHPVFTPMCIVANPNFDKIESHDFTEYFYEPFTDTAIKYDGSENICNLWLKGRDANLFYPQFHGREHLNVKRWMKLLRENHLGIKTAFHSKSIGASKFNKISIPSYLPAFDIDTFSDIKELENIVITGTKLFESLLNYKPKYFIASNSPEPKSLENILLQSGIELLTRYKIQKYPLGDNKWEYEFNWLGRVNKLGQMVITRNCGFEPSDFGNNNWVDTCLKEIENAFFWNKPAIISSHRVNYISGLSQKNSDFGLNSLSNLIKLAIKKWPEIEFMTTMELGTIISQHLNNE
jgi:hypothetical protein